MAETEEQVPQTETETTTEPEVKTENGENEQNEQKTESDIATEEEPEYIRDPILDQEEMKKMFVGGIAPDSTDEELQTFFEEMSGGVVEDKVIIRKEGDNKKNHFGFITFATSELVDEVLLKREQLKFKEKLLDVNRAVPKNNNSSGAHEKTKKLFIANLPKMGCSSDDLMKYFLPRHPKKYGTIEKIQLIKKKDTEGNPMEENRGYGFIVVSSEDLADKMAIQHQNFEFGGRKIELKKSVPNNEGGGRKRGGGRGAGGMSGGNQQYNAYGAGYGGGYWDPYSSWDPYAYGGGYGGYSYAPQGGPPRGRGGGNNRYRPY